MYRFILLALIALTVGSETQAGEWHVMSSNTWRFWYMRNPDASATKPAIWVYEYEPVLGISTHYWDVGLKGRIKDDGSEYAYQPLRGYGYGLYARWKPRERLQKLEDKFCNEIGKMLVRNSFVSASIERTNLFLDSIYIFTTKDKHLNNL
ncbi:MAG: hypothetical protein KDC92_06830, partial [Bacteroidetes bacterium]|nr:hypothetical protein [Bacteroidota bacterium]